MASGPEDKLTIAVPEGHSGRLDKVLARLVPEGAGLSRSRLQALLAEGRVHAHSGAPAEVKTTTQPGDVWVITQPAPQTLDLRPEAVPLDIAYED
ncbi:MAG: RNA pseudouridine synthase, partial [Pseudomonadota bacterium]